MLAATRFFLLELIVVSNPRASFLSSRTAWFAYGILTCALAACSGGTFVTPHHVLTSTPTPTATQTPATPSAESAATTVPLVAGSPIAVPSAGGYSGYVVFTTAVGTPFPSNATVTLQTFVAEPASGTTPQARRGGARRRFDSTARAIVSVLATFHSSVTLANTSLALELPNDTSSTPYGAETFDESSGQLVAYASEMVGLPPTGSPTGPSSFVQFAGDTPPYTVTPNVPYLTIVVADPAAPPQPSPEPAASCSASPPPQVTPSPISSTESAPQTSTVCNADITIPSIGSFSGQAIYFTGAYGSAPPGLAVTVQSFVGEPPGGPAPQFRSSGKRRFDAESEPQAVASLRSTFSANAMLTDNFDVYLPNPNSNSATTYTAETYDETSGQLLYFVQGSLDPTGYGDYLFASPGTAYAVSGGTPILTLFVASSAVSPAP